MIDNKTTNKQYPLPNPANIASQDVERIATTISMIDTDISNCETTISDIGNNIGRLERCALRIPESQVGVIDPELKNLAARKYLVVNSDATGFTTVEGGGGEGGKQGEILVKNSDENFDTKWIDPRAVLKQSGTIQNVTSDYSLPNNGLIILSDVLNANNEQLPVQGISPRQVTADIIADTFVGYILKDTIEGSDEDDNIATETKFGRVKIGTGVNVSNGVISVPQVPIASTEEFGLVKIGSGLTVNRGVVSATEVVHASHNDFGIVKLGSDFAIGSNEELVLANAGVKDAIVYQGSKIEVCTNNTIVINEGCARYRLFIDDDSTISFDWSQIEPRDDLSFEVELFAAAAHSVAFNEAITWDIPFVAVTPGKTVLKFTKPLYANCRATLVLQDEMVEKLLTIRTDSDDISGTYTSSCTGIGSDYYIGRWLGVLDPGGNWTTTLAYNADGAIILISFNRWTYCTRAIFVSDNYSNIFCIVEGSIDGASWTQLYSASSLINGQNLLIFQNRGYYRHYRLRVPDRVVMKGLCFYGYDTGTDSYEFKLITPNMTANPQNGITITAHTAVNAGALYNITQIGSGDAYFDTADNDGHWWVKYELPEAKIVNFVNFATGTRNEDYGAMWFKIEGSNDDQNWTLLLERQYQSRLRRNAVINYAMDNTIAYKYYKFTVLQTNNGTLCSICRVRLFYKETGMSVLDNLVPKMLAAVQDGYEITTNSDYNTSQQGFKAFDGDPATVWSTVSNAIPAWLQIKCPTAICCDAISITSRDSSTYYTQAPQNFEVQGSNDGENWQTLHSVVGAVFTGSNQTKIFQFNNIASFQYYRLYVTQTNGSTAVALSTLELGRLYKKYAVDI